MVARPSLLRALAGVVTGLALTAPLVTSLAAAAPASAKPDEDRYDAPLEITIDSLTPGVLPRTGPLVVTGTVTNTDLETWSTIRLYPLFDAGSGCTSTTCGELMTTAADLALAAESDPEAPVGVRETSVRYDIASLEPGQSTSYRLTVPQRVLRQLFPERATGVHWFGVHALGASATTPDDTNADGRARTFLPSVRRTDGPQVPTAVVLPLRKQISHAGDGTITDADGWEDALGVEGPLGGPLAFGAASGAAPVTWLLDPAVPDAVRRLAQGNPAREVVPVTVPEDPSPSGSASPDGEEEAEEDPALETPVARAARSWLVQAQRELGTGTVAALPYGDPDLTAAADTLPSLYRSAREQVATELEAWQLETVPVAGAPDGFLDAEAIESVDDGAALLLGDRMFPREMFSDRPPVAGLVGDRPVLVVSHAAAEGGPGPDEARAPVALRQRILAEGVVRLLRARGQSPDPLVVVLPTDMPVAGAAAFWSGLDVPWLDLSSLDELVVPPGGGADGKSEAQRELDPMELSYPEAQADKDLPGSVLVEAGQLIRAARSYAAILGEEYTVGTDLVREALTGSSYSQRGDDLVATRLHTTREWVEDQLEAITIEAPDGVTLSGTSGGFNISVRNDLDVPVTVAISASADSGARIEVANPIRLAAQSRTSVPIDATMSRTGVHNVTLRITDTDGTALGGIDTLPMRTGQAGVVIWAIMGTGAGILFVAIAIRLVRRYRRRGEAPA
ncbi:DUF6049 family protein [Nocardioides sp. J9]|uniref:DUF6049 family protein n=1 Tax=Nocardioides sp. J9 TaxID=935844 RepID=UPI0011A5502D|nr:DUF6049 family protein [Nocardioides sp. J9]